MDQIIKLIDISLVDGRLNQDDYRIIKKKADSIGMTDEELNLIISKRTISSNAESINFSRKGDSVFPYVFAIIAIGTTFLDWIEVYSRSSVMGTSGGWETSFTAWWGGYGASLVLIFLVGLYFYQRGSKLFWLAGLLAVADAFYIYSTIASSDVSVSYNYEGYGGSSEAGYTLLWGFWAFVAASALFSLTGLRKSGAEITSEHGNEGGSRFKRNIKAGWKPLVFSILISTGVNMILIGSDDTFEVMLTISFFIALVFTFLAFVIFIFGKSTRMSGYILTAVSFVLFIGFYLKSGEKVEIIEPFIITMTYSLTFVIINHLMFSRGSKASKGGQNLNILLLFLLLCISCSDSPRDNIGDSSRSISGTYTSTSGGVESTLTIMGNSWHGTHIESNFGHLISSGSGIVDGKKIVDQYGNELGYISNEKAYMILGGTEVTLYKD